MSSRRTLVPFDPYYFERRAREGQTYDVRGAFEHIHRSRLWTGSESVSGEGAGAAQTSRLATELPVLLREIGTRTLLDLPCGDYGWMKDVDLPVERYIGGDIVPALIAENQARHADERHVFLVLDLTRDTLPAADLLLCRDALVHLSFTDIGAAVANVRHSGIPFLLATTFPDHPENEDILTGDWRLLNLQRAPFRWPAPLRLLNEGCTEGGGRFADKSLGLWAVADLR
jgi:hypothetical protein